MSVSETSKRDAESSDESSDEEEQVVVKKPVLKKSRVQEEESESESSKEAKKTLKKEETEEARVEKKEKKKKFPGVRELCHMKGVMRARYGLSLDHGAAATVKWAYLKENVDSEYAQEGKYDVFRVGKECFQLKGSFIDDPTLYGNGVRREDEMEMYLQDLTPMGTVFTGSGYCSFYGPYAVDGLISVTGNKRSATFTIRKRDATRLSIPHNILDWSDDEDDDDPQPQCEPGCCCDRHAAGNSDSDSDFF